MTNVLPFRDIRSMPVKDDDLPRDDPKWIESMESADDFLPKGSNRLEACIVKSGMLFRGQSGLLDWKSSTASRFELLEVYSLFGKPLILNWTCCHLSYIPGHLPKMN